MLTNLKGCQDIWRNVKNLDIDKNGFISTKELEDLIRDYYPT
jgi:cysteine sulfinate desulfinase/cysteine desulfurase-like protein